MHGFLQLVSTCTEQGSLYEEKYHLFSAVVDLANSEYAEFSGLELFHL